ncbi:hypothetical protein Tco_1321465 [Tanacetum coccineum]
MGTKVTSSSGSVLEEPEIQKLQMQAKIFKENSLNKLNALKSTTQLLERQTFSGCLLYQQAFAQLFGDGVRTFKFQLSQHMNNLETQLNAETLHEMDSKSALSVIKVQFERFINSDLLKPLDIYSRSFSSDREVRENFRDYTKMTAQTFKETIIQNMNSIEQCIIERASHEQELKMTLKKLSERQLQIQQCKVQEVQSSVTSSGDETSSGIVSDEEIDKQKLEAHYSYMAKIQEVSPEESSSTSQPLEQVQNHDENDVFANVRRHSEQPESINDTYVLEKDDSNVIPDSSNICTNDNQVDQNAAECVDERAALANLIANLTLDTEENKTDLKAQMQDKNIAISELKKLIENCKGKSVETQFNKPSVVRQPNAQRIPKPSVLGKPTPFSKFPEMRSGFQTGNATQLCTGKVESEPRHWFNSRLSTHILACKQLWVLSGRYVIQWSNSNNSIDITADALYNEKQEIPKGAVQASVFMEMTSVHIVRPCSSSLTSDYNHSETRYSRPQQ